MRIFIYLDVPQWINENTDPKGLIDVTMEPGPKKAGCSRYSFGVTLPDQTNPDMTFTRTADQLKEE